MNHPNSKANLQLTSRRQAYPRDVVEINGEMCYRCTRCGNVKHSSKFHKSSRSKYGLNPQCIICISKYQFEKRRSPGNNELENNRKRAAKMKRMNRLADDKYQRWMQRQRDGLKVPLGKKGWSKDYDACTGCGTFFHPHHGKGMCQLCYHRDYYGHKRVHEWNRRGAWSREHDHCLECKRTDRMHRGHGLCTYCYWKKHERKLETPKYCNYCGGSMEGKSAKAKFCSEACCMKSARRRKGLVKAGKNCVKCGVFMPGVHGRTKWCGDCHPRGRKPSILAGKGTAGQCLPPTIE